MPAITIMPGPRNRKESLDLLVLVIKQLFELPPLPALQFLMTLLTKKSGLRFTWLSTAVYTEDAAAPLRALVIVIAAQLRFKVESTPVWGYMGTLSL